MDADLEKALLKRRELSGEIMPTGGGYYPVSVEEAALQIQSMMIGANQSKESRNPEAMKFFLKQMRDIVKANPAVVEQLRKLGISAIDRFNEIALP